MSQLWNKVKMKLFIVLALGIAIFGIHFNSGRSEETQEGDFMENLNLDNYSDDEDMNVYYGWFMV